MSFSASGMRHQLKGLGPHCVSAPVRLGTKITIPTKHKFEFSYKIFTSPKTLKNKKPK